MKLKKLGLLTNYTDEIAHVVENIAMQRLQGRNQGEKLSRGKLPPRSGDFSAVALAYNLEDYSPQWGSGHSLNDGECFFIINKRNTL